MDTITVNDIRVFGYTGALPEENILGQWFRVDLVIQLDLFSAGCTDDLADTYNYADAIQIVQNLIQQQPHKLIESVASNIARSILKSDERLTQITVKLTKLSPPIPDFTGEITIAITRDRTHIQQPTPPILSIAANV